MCDLAGPVNLAFMCYQLKDVLKLDHKLKVMK